MDDSLKPMYLFNNLIDHMDQRSLESNFNSTVLCIFINFYTIICIYLCAYNFDNNCSIFINKMVNGIKHKDSFTFQSKKSWKNDKTWQIWIQNNKKWHDMLSFIFSLSNHKNNTAATAQIIYLSNTCTIFLLSSTVQSKKGVCTYGKEQVAIRHTLKCQTLSIAVEESLHDNLY